MELDNYNKKRGSFLSYFICGLLGSIFGCALLLLFGPGTIFATLGEVQKPEPIIQVSQQMTTVQAITDIGYASSMVMPAVVGIVRQYDLKTKANTKVENKLGKGIKVTGDKTKIIKQTEIVTGVIVDPEGYILTNNNLGDTTDDLTICLYDGTNVIGSVVWADKGLDISIIKINEKNLQFALLGDSQSPKIGDVAIAIGNPLGLKFQRSVTSGIISAVNRTVKLKSGITMEDLLQTDASINTGNSGGPLINIKGEVIGISTAEVKTTEGMGFAIPTNIVKPIIASLKKYQTFKTPIIGIEGIDKDMTAYSDLNVKKGVYVYDSKFDGPGYKAGIRMGDSIVGINGKKINTLLDLKEVLYGIGVDGTAVIDIETKENTYKTLNVILIELK